MKESWRPVKGYEETYEVSNIGRVRSLPRKNTKGKILSSALDRYGYEIVSLSQNNRRKTMTVHRLVANAFLPREEGKNVVNHIDENKLNNNADNLEWCDVKYNTNYGSGIEKRSAKRRKKIVGIKGNQVIRFSSLLEAEKKLGLSHGNISEVLHGHRKTCGGYKWEYYQEVESI